MFFSFNMIFKILSILLFQGGNYVLTLMDVYGGGIAVLFIAITECIFLIWVYGKIRFTDTFKSNVCTNERFILKCHLSSLCFLFVVSYQSLEIFKFSLNIFSRVLYFLKYVFTAVIMAIYWLTPKCQQREVFYIWTKQE